MTRSPDDSDPAETDVVPGARTPAAAPGAPGPAATPARTPDSNPLHAAETAFTTTDAAQAAQTAQVASSERRPTLDAGSLIDGRYEVLRFIASGGMGEVYEVQDRELGERVALKTIRADVGRDAEVMQRFKREILIARKVSHPNVCRIFDLGKHEPERAGAEPVQFLTMEMLAGETLFERVRRLGPFTTAEALPLVRQMCWGLSAAHKAGVVHRDFKSGNVMLIPLPGGGTRVAVTDFGQARLSQGDASVAGLVLGTPAYMAPEQVRGEKATETADVYALGVVLFEMVTGRWPFVGGSAMSIASRRLTEDPPAPRTLTPTLDPRWEAVILRCLRREPEARFHRVIDVVRTLEGRFLTRWMRHPAVAALLLAVVCAAALGGWRMLQRDVPAPPAVAPAATPAPVAAAPARRQIAVLGFRNISGRAESSWLAPALTEMLATELAAGGQMRTVPGEEVARARLELAVTETDGLAPDTLSRLRARLGADLVVRGSYVAVGSGRKSQVRVDLRAQDARSGDTVAAVSETGEEADLLPLLARLGARFREALGLGTLSAGDAGAVRAALPRGSAATRAYAEGLAHLHRLDALAARDLLQSAIAADRSFPLAHAALAEAWSMLGYDANARREGKLALELSESLAREDRLAIEGRYWLVAKDWPKAIQVYTLLSGFFPDSLEHGLRLAGAQASAGEGEEAMKTLARLRTLPQPAGLDPRIDLAEAQVAEAQSDFRRGSTAAQAAIRKGRSSGSVLLVARAQRALGWALLSLGDPPAAVAALTEALRTFEAAGDRSGRAGAILNLGITHARQGDLAGARRRYQEALAEFRQIGDRGGESRALNNLAIMEKDSGNLRVSLTMQTQGLSIARETADRTGMARSLNNIGVVQRMLGDLPAARRSLEECLALAREVGSASGVARSLNNLSAVLRDGGELARARAAAEESVNIYRKAGEKAGVGRALENLGLVLADQDQLAAARQAHAEALELRQSLGEAGTSIDSLLNIAGLDILEGRPAEAERVAREMLAHLRKDGRREQETEALDVLARALLAAQRPADAREPSSQALARAGGSVPVRTGVAITAARVSAALGDLPAAARALATAEADARRAGFVGLALQARLYEARLEAQRNPAVGARRLAVVARDAQDRGFLTIARLAQAR